MTKGYDEFVYETDGTIYLRLCVAITVYFEGKVEDHAVGVRHFYATALERIGAHVRFYQTDSMRKPKPVKDRSADAMAALLHFGEKVPMFYKLYLESEDASQAASRYSITVYTNRLKAGGALRLAVPVEEVLDREDRFVALAGELTRKLAFASGYGGFSFNRAEESDLEGIGRNKSAALSHRWYGIDIEQLSTTIYAIARGLKSAGWLTLVGSKLLDALGGTDALQRALPAEALVHPLPSGVLIQAGPRPLLGDVNRKEDLQLYRAVGRVLAPVRSPGHPIYLYKSAAEGEDDGWTQKWLARFDS
jgi:hypothetical protein